MAGGSQANSSSCSEKEGHIQYVVLEVLVSPHNGLPISRMPLLSVAVNTKIEALNPRLWRALKKNIDDEQDTQGDEAMVK
mmetsp:Transcript_4286/g.7492  ORF Transcript_4286/g.7492 Transcript_4286/m.7492 type:complete len:80 (+) Transcript_4286:729-968(+)